MTDQSIRLTTSRVTVWRTSSYTAGGPGNNCVEVGAFADEAAVAVRDSKNRAGGAFAVAAPRWHRLLAGVRHDA